MESARWRTVDSGFKIDASGQLVDGTQVDGPSSMRQALMNRPEAFVGTMTEKLLMYALGRENGVLRHAGGSRHYARCRERSL